jgi:hypothetical protein
MPVYKEYDCLNCGLHCKKQNVVGKFCSLLCQHAYELKSYKAQWLAGEWPSSRTIKRILLNESANCSECGLDKWNGKDIVLELEHKNGNSDDNSPENVCLLCPNCHSQTPTYKAKNVGNGRHARRQRYAEGKSY